ncbi:outer membrane beta-barrel protein [Portibacter lacus]|uniref:Porin n=1 Tax=Portibacter lacus TaxID=1099794 RepID=A0AA37SQQ4_9BACT|nr:outer membrane beta-barrel protein [Portibacter lacus]GLR17814.1 hypothetical protein GCM10007940_24290 [Portibacter lacus]
MKKNILTLVFSLVALFSFAQINIDSSFTLSGSVDVYYRGNLNASNNPTPNADGFANTTAPGTSFANGPGFSLGMFNLISAYDGDKVGFVADMVFGPRGAEAVFGSPPPLNIVNQLYGYWNVTDKVTLTLGNFNTFLGYEVISPTANFNYSTSYMFSYGPFSHSGIKMDVDLGGGFSGMLGVFNPTDATDFNPSGDYVAGAQLGYTNDMGGAWLNLIISDGFYQVDLTTGWQVTEKAYLGLNATTAQDNFSGAAIYAQYATSDALSLGFRGEYFADSGVEVIGTDESVIDLTLSANYKVGNLTIIPEFRIDLYSNDAVVLDVDAGEVGNSLASFLLAAVYAF